MATIKLDTMLDEVSSKLGNVVYSEWKGIKYVRKYVKAKDANSESQIVIRNTFSGTVGLWKLIPETVQSVWNYHVRNKPLTGYNLFVKRNFEAVKDGKMLEISKGNGLKAPWNLSASINTNGEISISFELDQSAGNATVFVQKLEESDRKMLLVEKIDAAGAGLPVVLQGFDAGAKYFAYAVATDKSMNESVMISDSVSCEVKTV